MSNTCSVPSKMTLKPLADRVVLELLENEEMTSGGIFIPETAREKPQRAKVLAVGPGKMTDGKLEAMTVQVGDVVLFAKYSGTDVKLEGLDVKIMSEKDILAIVS